LKLVPDHIQAIDPYIPGKPNEELEREYGLTESVKLASNENPSGTAPAVIEAIKKAADKVNLYPDGNAFYLRTGLSKKYNVPIEQIICGSGSVDILEMLPRAFLGDDENVVTSEMTFPTYKIACYFVNTNFRAAPVKDFGYNLDAMLDLIDEKTKMILIANPNNPTGTMIKRKELESFMNKIPDHPILVLDEAYFEYIDDPDYPNGLDYLNKRDRIIIIRTFSKIHGLAGLRIGYGFAPLEIINAMNKVRSPFNANSIAQAAAVAALGCDDHVKKSRELNRKGIEYLSAEFDRIGLKYVPSYGNFLLTFPEKPADEVDEELKKRGFIVRKGGKAAIRISIGDMDQNKNLLKVLEEIL